MRTIAYISMVFLLLQGCTDSTRVREQTVKSDLGGGVQIITVDGCEYVYVKQGYGAGLAHKGNCSNIGCN